MSRKSNQFSAQSVDEKAQEATDFLKALAHDQRLSIVCLLLKGEMTVTEIQHALGTRQAATSQQITRLRLSGLVSGRREGKEVYYSVSDEKVHAVIATLQKSFCRDDE